ncbi:MAG: hypothetical protein LW834_00385 [Cyanobium sp. 49614_E6]|jgi:hypothetical protein|nr:hypothetical protein [Cyanobium sp. 49614_E6]
MAASSTNKQPLLIDRPLMVVTKLDNTTSPSGAVDPGTGSNGVLLVDCTSGDGAVIDSIWLIQRVASNQGAVNLYISSSAHSLGVTATGGAANAHFLGRLAFTGAVAVGETTEFKLPKILAPVPHAGSNDAGGNPPQYRALYLQKGQALWAAVESTTAVAGAPNIACQGGYF